MSKELRTLLIVGGVIVAVVGILIAVVRYKDSQKPVAADAVIRSDSHVAGASSAPATLVEFGDYQCPACGQAEPVIQQLRKDFAEGLRFSFRNFPLVSIHPNATRAAHAAEAAAKQDKFWEMHDLLYEQQSTWANMGNPNEQFKAYAKQIGIDENKFMSDMNSTEVSDRVNQDVSDGEVLGVNSTPTFYLNGKKVEDSSYEGLKKQIQAIIDAAGDKESQSQSTPSATPSVTPAE